ncbi:cbb3-type cytochrome oxidase subunit 3 [Methylibium rhizosphaerae]|jgi:cytochrome c oxidase cbb3-type subunit 4|uniref:cbb3-type cytochrome oxidase subunit 3 n=1 Tax=Methylibium rhizosphaerae TaxID=2570323 RepID=UPI0011282749|nr:cbb3-type cytochrome c oxidase subunit 3 [Methylibium rhizosphaerae]
MDLNMLRSGVTLVSLLLFVGIAAWAWLPRRRADFERAAMAPFAGEAEPASNGNGERS